MRVSYSTIKQSCKRQSTKDIRIRLFWPLTPSTPLRHSWQCNLPGVFYCKENVLSWKYMTPFSSIEVYSLFLNGSSPLLHLHISFIRRTLCHTVGAINKKRYIISFPLWHYLIFVPTKTTIHGVSVVINDMSTFKRSYYTLRSLKTICQWLLQCCHAHTAWGVNCFWQDVIQLQPPLTWHPNRRHMLETSPSTQCPQLAINVD